MKPVNVAFVGAGSNASGHMKRVSAVEGAQIVAICDIDEERAEAAAKAYGAKTYTDYSPMIERENLSALYVSVPPFAHYDAEILAAQKGVHLFVEKPVALTMEKGLEICEAVEKAGIITCVGYQVRYGNTVDRAKKFLEGRTIAMVASNRWGGMAPKPWWWRMDQSGGQIVEQTTHQFDMIRYLAGEITEVYANYALRTLTHVEGLDIPDVGVVTLMFESGAIGYVSSSCALNKGGGGGNLDIILKDVVLKWSHNALSTAPPGEYEELQGEIPPAPSIDEVFIKAVQIGDGSQIRSPYQDALKSLDVTLAANQAAAERKPIKPYFAAH